MRYYNENPQVTRLLEKIKEQDKIIKEQRETIEFLHSEVYSQSQFRKKELCRYKEWKKKIKSDYKVVESEIDNFNSLPWYKKMFYKLKV